MNRTIGQVATKVGVSTETLRRWEKGGLIPSAKRQFIANWRVWTDEEVAVIEYVVKDRSRVSQYRKR